jgi:hypothetical protein
MMSAPCRSKTLTRRRLQAGGITVALGGTAIFAASWCSIVAQAGKDGTLSTPDAHAAVVSGVVTLLDIRRPDQCADGCGRRC